MRIGLDVDNTIRDFTGALRKVFIDYYPEYEGKILEHTSWDLAKAYPIGKDIYEFCFNSEATNDIFYEVCRPYDDVEEGMNELKSLGHTLFAATTQTKITEPLVKKWLDYYEFPFDGYYFLRSDLHNNMLSNGKSVFDIDLLFDDGHHNIEEFVNANKLAICRIQPWNEIYKEYYKEHNVPCVHSFTEFVEYIKNNYKG